MKQADGTCIFMIVYPFWLIFSVTGSFFRTRQCRVPTNFRRFRDYTIVIFLLIQIIPSVIAIDEEIELPEFDCSDIELAARPSLSGDEFHYEDELFLIHYTDDGVDATTMEWVEAIAEAIQLSLDVQIVDMGFAFPPADCGEGGDSRLDIYVKDVGSEGVLGVAVDENIVADNPNTEAREFYAAYSFLMIDNDMAEFANSDPIALMQLSVAHELHHTFQFGYDVDNPFFAFYEAGAVWIETIIYPDKTMAVADVDALFDAPDRCIGAFEGRAVGDTRIYGEWLMIDSFTRDLGIDSYRFIWESMDEAQGLFGFYQALDVLGTSPQEVIERMAIRNLLLDYKLSSVFESTVAISTSIDDFGLVADELGVQELAVDYVQITKSDVLHFELAGAQDLTLFIVGINQTLNEARVYDIRQAGTVDVRDYDAAYLLILNTKVHTNSYDCHYQSWIVQVSDGTGNVLVSADDEIWDASNYKKID